MRGALAYEWRRITTVRSTYWFSAMALAFSALVALFIAIFFSSSDFSSDGVSDFFEASTLVVTAGASVIFVPVISAPFCAVMGAMSFGHEYRYGTIKQTLVAIPSRITVYAAKLIVLVGWLFALMVVIVVVNLALGALLLTGFGLDGSSVRPILEFIFYNVGYGIAGFGLAAVLRSLAGALVAVLIYPLVGEPIAFNIVRAIQVGTLDRLSNLLPASAGRRTIYLPYERFANPLSDTDVVTHTWGLAASTAIFWVGLLVLLGAGLLLFLKRDA